MHFVMIGALNGAMAVAMGAVAAHLVGSGDASAAETMRTAAYYQAIHALALVGVAALGLATGRVPFAAVLSGAAFTGGLVLFCGALYGSAHGAPAAIDSLAPFGGMLLIFGWLALAVAAAVWRPSKRPQTG